jgi:CRISPR-associated endonuclease/helicase Cas3
LRGQSQISLPDAIDPWVQAVYEEAVEIPDSIQERHMRTLIENEGKQQAHTIEANKAIIGFPDDASWNDPARFTLFDEDEPGIHRTLMAHTRLGDDSVVAIPLWDADAFDVTATPDFTQAKAWFMRSISLSRKGIVKQLQKTGVPEGWKKNPLLRNAYALRLDAASCWADDASVRLDDELGLIYEATTFNTGETE